MATALAPLDLQSELDDIAGQRALITALRAREGLGEQYGGFSQLLGGLGRAAFGDPLTKLADRERSVTHEFEAGRASALSDLMKMDGNPLSDSGMSPEQEAAVASRAMSAGVPQELVQRALGNRQAFRMLQSIGAGPMPSAAAAPPQPQGAPTPQPGAQPGGMMPFVAPAPAANGDAGSASAIAGAMRPKPTGTPLQAVPDGKLITLGAILPKDNPLASLVGAELKAREIQVKDGIVTRGGTTPVGRFDPAGTFTDFTTGQTVDMQGNILANRARQTARANAENEVVTVTGPDGRTRTVPKASLLPPDSGAAPTAPAAPSARTADFNLKGATREQAQAALEAAFNGVPPAAAGAADIATGPDPVEQAGRTAAQQELTKGATDTLVKGRENAQQAATVNIPAIDTVRSLLDSGKVNTGLGADFKTQFGRALKLAGLSDDDGVAATQAFVAESAKRVMGTIKMLGSGSGISDSDREYAAKAVGGQIALDEGAIRRILDIDDRVQRAVISTHNANVDRGAKFFQSPDQQAFYTIEMPAAYKRAAAQSRVVNFADLPK